MLNRVTTLFFPRRRPLSGVIFNWAASLLLATAALALQPNQPDSYEPDDTPAQAKTILTNGTKQTRTIHHPDDGDIAKFNLSGPARVTVWTDGQSQADSTLISLFDSTGEFLGFNDRRPDAPSHYRYSYLQLIVIPQNPTPETFYPAVRSAGTQYYRWWNIDNNHDPDATVPENPFTKRAFDSTYDLYAKVDPLPSGNYAPEKLNGKTVISIAPAAFNKMTTKRYRFGDGVYSDPDVRSQGIYTYEKLSPAIGRVFFDGGFNPLYLIFQSPRGGDAEAYVFNAETGEMQSATTVRFVLENETPLADGTVAKTILRENLYAPGHNWTYGGARTYRNGIPSTTPLNWERTVSGVETVGGYADAPRVRERRGLTTTYSTWLEGNVGTFGVGMYLLKDGARVFGSQPVPHLPRQINPGADFMPLPASYMVRPPASADDPNIEISIQDYLTYLGSERITVPFGSVDCEKIAVLRTWRDEILGFGYTYALEWHSASYGLVKQEFTRFEHKIAGSTSESIDGYYQLNTTSVVPRPPLEVDFDVDFLVELGEADNDYPSGAKQITPGWRLLLANNGQETTTVSSVTFVNDAPFANLAPPGFQVSGDSTVWNDIPIPAGTATIFEGLYTTGPIERQYSLDVSRQWAPAMVGDGDEIEATVTVGLPQGMAPVDVYEVEIAFLGTVDIPGQGTGATFANLTFVSSSTDDDQAVDVLVDTPQVQNSRWRRVSPPEGSVSTFNFRVRFNLLPPYQSVLVEPIVRIKHKNSHDGGLENWVANQLAVDYWNQPPEKTVTVEGVRLEPEDGYIAATRLHFHHQHRPFHNAQAADLPPPVVDLASMGPTADGLSREYVFEIVNFADYPAFLFAQSPFIDAAGRATPGARTLVTLRTAAGALLAEYEFDSSLGLVEIVYSELIGEPPMDTIVIQLEDRLTDKVYQSDIYTIDPAGYTLITRRGWNFLSFPTGAATRGNLLEDTFGVGVFANWNDTWGWASEKGAFVPWRQAEGIEPGVQVFWGYTEAIVAADFTPDGASTTPSLTFETPGWHIFSLPADSDVTAEDILALPGVGGLWRWQPTLGRFLAPHGKLDHRHGYWIHLDTAPATIDF